MALAQLDKPWLVAGAAGTAVSIAVALSTAGCKRRRQREYQAGKAGSGPQPAWEWFCFSNVVAVSVFITSASYLLDFWMTHMRSLTPAFAFAQPGFSVALLGALGSLLYFFAFFGVAFIHQDVSDWMAKATQLSGAAAAAKLKREADADVVIVGMGLVGSALAAILSRQGKKVIVLERTMELRETIKGELLQPGGVRVLERLGLAECAKAEAVDPVRVDGYVVISPAKPTKPQQDIILSYPNDDPATMKEYFGVMNVPATVVSSASAAAATAAAAAAAAAKLVASTVAVETPYTGATLVDAVTGMDVHPRGRSFYNTRLVQQLRDAARSGDGVQVISPASAQRLLTAKEYAQAVALRNGDQAAAVKPDTRSGVSFTDDPDRVIGVVYEDEAHKTHALVAPLTIVCDGMYSTLRKSVHTNSPRTVSHFCGLLLKHPVGKGVLPYPNRGHVILADPNPVLMYQISSTETRVLVDVSGELPDAESGGLQKYFLDVIAPQLPECLRGPFIAAAVEQEAVCMPNRALNPAPIKVKGAVMIGDTLNMRHPLTGGGMTVALKDTELLLNCMQDVAFPYASTAAAPRGSEPGCVYDEAAMQAAVARFQETRANHAATINILANALYRVFTKPENDDGTRERLRGACIAYLGLGGAYSAGPIGLLSGLTPKPEVLVTHFFLVAGLAMRQALLPLPTPSRLRQSYDLLRVACIIICPLLAAEKVTFMSSAPVLGLLNAIFNWKAVDPFTM